MRCFLAFSGTVDASVMGAGGGGEDRQTGGSGKPGLFELT